MTKIDVSNEDFTLYVDYDENNKPIAIKAHFGLFKNYKKYKKLNIIYAGMSSSCVFKSHEECQEFIEYALSVSKKCKILPEDNKYNSKNDYIEYIKIMDKIIIKTTSIAIVGYFTRFAIKDNYDFYYFTLDDDQELFNFTNEYKIISNEIPIKDKISLELKTISFDGWRAWFKISSNDTFLNTLLTNIKEILNVYRKESINIDYEKLSYHEMSYREAKPINQSIYEHQKKFILEHICLNLGEIEEYKKNTLFKFEGLEHLKETSLVKPLVKISNIDIPGYINPLNQMQLKEYQKCAIDFFVSKGGRFLLGDDMGTGKTAQAIACANAVGCKNILIVAPAVARYVWDEQIQLWNADAQTISHINSTNDNPDGNSRWNIVSYDLFSMNSGQIELIDESDLDEFKIIANKSIKNDVKSKQQKDKLFESLDISAEKIKYSKTKTTLMIDTYIDYIPNFKSQKTADQYNKIMRSLSGEFTNKFLNSDFDLIIMDEAHKVKNSSSSRSQELFKLAKKIKYIIAMTGTPIRNNEDEVANILKFVDPKHPSSNIKDHLHYKMLRRTIKDVLPELPNATREKWYLKLMNESMLYIDQCDKAIQYAENKYYEILKDSNDEYQAGKAYLAGLKTAATYAGMAKVADGQIALNIANIVEEKECCLVYVEHHEVGDLLQKQLQKMNIKTVRADGRNSPQKRKQAADDFQNGKVDVFIGGTLSTGESLTMTRSQVVCFVEFNWVPGAMVQAERRGLRSGQKSDKYFVIYYTAKDIYLDNVMMNTLIKKCDLITKMLDEDSSIGLEKKELNEKELIKLLLNKNTLSDSLSIPVSINPSITSKKWKLDKENKKYAVRYIEESYRKGNLVLNKEIDVEQFNNKLSNINNLNENEFNQFLIDHIDFKSIKRLRDSMRSKKSKENRDLKQITLTTEAWKKLNDISKQHNVTLSQAILNFIN